MPIKPENKARYPKDWPAIRAAILKRAGNRCEWPGCGVVNHSVGSWIKNDGKEERWAPICGSGPADATGQGLTWPDLKPISYGEARTWVNEPTFEGHALIVIVLTVAHRDHTPENCAPDNLAAWCQRHHLAYDQAHHTTNAYMTRKARMGNLELAI
jgi:hypothetical protein